LLTLINGAVQMHSMLAFEFAGGWSDFKGSIAVTVLQFLLGGGGSFSSGGPGETSPVASPTKRLLPSGSNLAFHLLWRVTAMLPSCVKTARPTLNI
jgi:hypothetical protein